MDPELASTAGRSAPDEGERALLARFAAGEREAFHGLVRPHLPSLRSFARRLAGDPHGADDLVQETLVRAFRGLEGFAGRAALRTWMFRIMSRLASEPRRWRGARPQDEIALEIPDGLGPGPAESAVVRELQDRVEEALERLSPRQRAALHLRAVEGFDYAAVADALGCTPAAARMAVLAARKHVMARIGRYLEP